MSELTDRAEDFLEHDDNPYIVGNEGPQLVRDLLAEVNRMTSMWEEAARIGLRLKAERDELSELFAEVIDQAQDVAFGEKQAPSPYWSDGWDAAMKHILWVLQDVDEG